MEIFEYFLGVYFNVSIYNKELDNSIKLFLLDNFNFKNNLISEIEEVLDSGNYKEASKHILN
jgi:hypothetical protein